MIKNSMKNAVKLLFVILGLSITGFGQLSFTANGTQTINFSTTVSGVNNGTFNGTGFTPTPGIGQIDSDAFAINGFSDGDLAFGGTATTGDFARGGTTGGVTTGGIYSYTPNPAIYIQPGGSDFTPGDITLRIQNNGTTNIEQLTLTYDILVLNDQARANSFNFSFSLDDTTYFPVGGLNYTSPEAADPSPAVATINRGPLVIGGLNIAPGAFFYVRWSGDDVSGSGGRDEFGLDNISVTAQFAAPTTTTFQVLNEIEVNNPGADLPNCHYAEIRGDANLLVNGQVYLLEVDGDDALAGDIQFVRDLTGVVFGTNGLITIIGASSLPFQNIKSENGVPSGPCGSRDYTTDGTTLINIPGLDFQNGATSFLLVSTTGSVITAGTDIDTNNDGVIDNLPMDATIIDAVGWEDTGATNFIYGGVNITPSTGNPDAATRNFANVTPLDTTAWFADGIVGENVSAVLYNQTNLFGGYMIDFITPGRQNLAPSAANGIINGRARTADGRGVKRAIIMLSGGTLETPIYTTTNQFGHYQFKDVGVGQTYILQASSGRYTFQNAIRVVNLEDSITDEDFIVEDFSRKSK